MVIHAEIVERSRKLYRCDGCLQHIEMGTSYVRCYGAAEPGDTP
jgi:hypothetical protein